MSDGLQRSEVSDIITEDVAPQPTLEQFKNNFSWVEDVFPLPPPRLIKIIAINVGITGNKELYAAEEISKAALSMVDKPVWYGSDHDVKQEVGYVVWAAYEAERLECVAYVEPFIREMVRKQEITRCSAEGRVPPKQMETIGDVKKPVGFVFDGILLVPNNIPVGDPMTLVTMMNRLKQKQTAKTETETQSQSQSRSPNDCGETHRLENDEAAKQTMSTKENLSADKTGGMNSASHLGEDVALMNKHMEELNSNFKTLTETLQGLSTSVQGLKDLPAKVETLTTELKNIKADVQPEAFAKRLKETLGERPQGKGLVSGDETVEAGEITKFSDLLQPNPVGNTGGQQ